MNNNPCRASFITDSSRNMLSQIKRVDEEGYLYKLDYTCDYYNPLIYDLFMSTVILKTGCSAFTTYNTDNAFLMARNYDYNHPDKDSNPTGQNLVIRTSPRGKLASIAICDSFWLNQTAYFKGTFDDGKTDVSNVVFAPYACVDGVNEAGVSAALLAIDTKDGEAPTSQNTGKNRTTIYALLRYLLDEAHSVAEAIDIAGKYDIFSTAGQDIHMVVADRGGNTAVFEWRQFTGDTEQKLYVTYTNVVTNFFVGFSDAQDMYRADGSLRERLSKVTGTINRYRYGYGHGYHRFNGIVSAMDRYIDEKAEANEHEIINSRMTDSQAFNILSVAAQEPGIEHTSMTQFSALYDMTNVSVTVCSEMDFSRKYTFSGPCD